MSYVIVAVIAFVLGAIFKDVVINKEDGTKRINDLENNISVNFDEISDRLDYLEERADSENSLISFFDSVICPQLDEIEKGLKPVKKAVKKTTKKK